MQIETTDQFHSNREGHQRHEHERHREQPPPPATPQQGQPTEHHSRSKPHSSTDKPTFIRQRDGEPCLAAEALVTVGAALVFKGDRQAADPFKGPCGLPRSWHKRWLIDDHSSIDGNLVVAQHHASSAQLELRLLSEPIDFAGNHGRRGRCRLGKGLLSLFLSHGLRGHVCVCCRARASRIGGDHLGHRGLRHRRLHQRPPGKSPHTAAEWEQNPSEVLQRPWVGRSLRHGHAAAAADHPHAFRHHQLPHHVSHRHLDHRPALITNGQLRRFVSDLLEPRRDGLLCLVHNRDVTNRRPVYRRGQTHQHRITIPLRQRRTAIDAHRPERRSSRQCDL